MEVSRIKTSDVLLMQPAAFTENYYTILIIAVPTIVFIFLIITRPHLLLVNNFFFRTKNNYYSVDHRYNEEKNILEKEIDTILEKISRTGMNSLTQKEKEKLKAYSRK